MKLLKSKLFWVTVVLLVVGLVWYGKSQDNGAAVGSVFVVTETDVVRTVTVSGSLVAQKYADLAFESAQMTMGRVLEVGARVGDMVVAGDELVRVDNSIARVQAYGAWQGARAQEELEKLARRKWSDLKPEEKARLKNLSAAARATAAASSQNASKTTIVAPFAGVVSAQNAVVGEAVPMGTVVRIIDLNSLQIEALVSESDIISIAPQMTGMATFDALATGDELEVRVDRIDPEATVIADVVYYKVYFVAFSGFPTGLRAGMSVDIDIVLESRQNVLAVPRRLVSSDSDGEFVFVLDSDAAQSDSKSNVESSSGSSMRKSVVTGLTGDSGKIEIISGLRGGELVVDGKK